MEDVGIAKWRSYGPWPADTDPPSTLRHAVKLAVVAATHTRAPY
jgi:hypothetical protein